MTRIALTSLTLLVFLFLIPRPANAQGILSNDQLLQGARAEGQNGHWVHAYGLLCAYVQRNAPELADPRFRNQIDDALKAALWNATNAGGGGGGGAAAGVSGKGDFMGGAAGDRPKKPFGLPAGPRPPRSYRLRCEGGGGMSAHYRVSGETAMLSVSFAKSPTAARARYPGPGRCAWFDRPLRNNEPRSFEWSFQNQHGISKFAFGGGGWAAQRGLSASGSQIAVVAEGIRSRALRTLVSKIRKGGIFDVACYNNGKGRLVVTHVY